MELDGDSPAFFHRRRRSPSSPLINPVVLILLLPILTILVLYLLLPPFITHTSRILKPSYSVKKSWDSLNIFLVLFAILCGFLAKRNDEAAAPASSAETPVLNRPSGGSAEDSFQSGDTQWFHNAGNGQLRVPETGLNRLRRSSSSYPDLRRDDLVDTADFRFRFFDDFELDMYRHHQTPEEVTAPPPSPPSPPENIKVIPVDTYEVRSSAPEPETSKEPPPEIQPPVSTSHKRRRSVQSVPRRRKGERRNVRKETPEEPPPPPPPPPPPAPPTPPTPPPAPQLEKKAKLQRRKSGTKELATAIASLYNQTKRNKKSKMRNIFENASDSPPSPSVSINEYESMLPPPTPPPPPPPLPPPPSKSFHNFFKKNSKNKRVHSVSTSAPPPPPPPPPPPNSIFNNIFKSGTKSKRFNINPQSSGPPPPPPPPPRPPSSILNTLFKTGTKSRRFNSLNHESPKFKPHNQLPRQQSWRPPLPTKSSNYQLDDNSHSGAQSPLHSMPPPPPLPPFKMRAAKFISAGDFVRIRSADSSRCSSPGLEDVDVASVRSLDRMEEDELIGADIGPDPGPSVICPSPDVNVKADNFIARLKDEWRTEIMNSRREKRKVA